MMSSEVPFIKGYLRSKFQFFTIFGNCDMLYFFHHDKRALPTGMSIGTDLEDFEKKCFENFIILPDITNQVLLR